MMRCSRTPSHCQCPVSIDYNIRFQVNLLSKVIDDIAYEVDCQMVTIKPGADIDIGW